MPYPKEELLHHIWQHRLFSQNGLKTTDGLDLKVVASGELNLNAGPDFHRARILIDGIEWAGNVEIHVRSSDWLKHHHQNNKAYSNIILHVVFEDDLSESLGAFPTLEIGPAISNQILSRYESLIGTKAELACGNQFAQVPDLIRYSWLDALLIERLKRKTEWLHQMQSAVHGDQEQLFQIALFRAFGMKVNAVPFELLAMTIPWKTLAKYKDNLFQLEAILFGKAGFLNFPEEDYQKALSKEYDFIKNKHGGEGMNVDLWKFARMHPKNFPTLRIAQLAALFHATGQFLPWFANRSADETVNGLMVKPSEYWQSHYRFGKEFPTKGNRIGKEMGRNILINALVPFYFVLAHRQAKPELQDKAMQILEQLKPERNAKTKVFENVGFKPANAAESQALIELKTNYCDHKKCLNCSIGANILKRDL